MESAPLNSLSGAMAEHEALDVLSRAALEGEGDEPCTPTKTRIPLSIPSPIRPSCSKPLPGKERKVKRPKRNTGERVDSSSVLGSEFINLSSQRLLSQLGRAKTVECQKHLIEDQFYAPVDIFFFHQVPKSIRRFSPSFIQEERRQLHLYRCTARQAYAAGTLENNASSFAKQLSIDDPVLVLGSSHTSIARGIVTAVFPDRYAVQVLPQMAEWIVADTHVMSERPVYSIPIAEQEQGDVMVVEPVSDAAVSLWCNLLQQKETLLALLKEGESNVMRTKLDNVDQQLYNVSSFVSSKIHIVELHEEETTQRDLDLYRQAIAEAEALVQEIPTGSLAPYSLELLTYLVSIALLLRQGSVAPSFIANLFECMWDVFPENHNLQRRIKQQINEASS